MRLQDELEALAICEFAFLQTQYHFGFPLVRRQGDLSVVAFLSQEIAIEVEIDLREAEAFLLLVRLESGQLPKDYYVSHGRRCRMHLETTIRERNWHIDEDHAAHLLPSGKKKRIRNVDELKGIIKAYRGLLTLYIDRILSENQTLF
jgi:hypothetical protein